MAGLLVIYKLAPNFNFAARYETPFWVMLADYQHYYFAFGCRELSSKGVCVEPGKLYFVYISELRQKAGGYKITGIFILLFCNVGAA